MVPLELLQLAMSCSGEAQIVQPVDRGRSSIGKSVYMPCVLHIPADSAHVSPLLAYAGIVWYRKSTTGLLLHALQVFCS